METLDRSTMAEDNPNSASAQNTAENKTRESKYDEDVFPSYLWEFPRMIPRERISTSESFHIVLKVIKVFMYILLFCGCLGCLVLSKGSLVLLTSSLDKWQMAFDRRDLRPNDQEDIERWRNTLITVLTICLAIPHALTLVIYIFKALFGSEPWPSVLGLIQTLVIETMHTGGACVLVFLVLPRMDMSRALLVLCACAVIPGICKVCFGMPPNFETVLPEESEGKAKSASRIRTVKELLFYVANFLALVTQATALLTLVLSNFESKTTTEWFLPETNEAVTTSVLSDNSTQSKDDRWDIFSRNLPDNESNSSRWYAPVALLLLSLSWWENFIEKDLRLFGGKLSIPLKTWKGQMHTWRQKSTVLTSAWNIVIILVFPFAFVPPFEYDIYVPNYNRKVKSQVAAQFAPLVTQVLSTVVGFFLGSLACRVGMQRLAFNLPLLLATPVTMGMIILQCHLEFIPMFGTSFEYFWHCPAFMEAGDISVGDVFSKDTQYWQVLVGVAWWISLMILTGHIWWPRQHTLDKAEKLFVRPLYSSIFLAESLLLNRRRRDNEVQVNWRGYVDYNPDDQENNVIVLTDEEKTDTKVKIEVTDTGNMVPKIYACATMWHENRNEMTQLLKSIFRMDKDQSKRRNLRMADPTLKDPDYYEYETHILFDDTMEMNDDDDFVPNQFVKTFVEVVDEAGSSVHHCAITLLDPVKTPTPYGGRLTWTLPGGTTMVVHLKDKNKIRHRKRWSQCMYMYYLLAYRLVGLRDDAVWENDKKGRFRKGTAFVPGSIFRYMPEEIAREAANTFIFTLDGDVDFKPDAVRILVDLMKKNPKVGAACGRIHPVGKGPVVWYQIFEYAISHWLQKAAEHVYGCVLCSPGCFSLYRASALMDDNVMRTYCTKAESPADYIQYDQGEDRWLCTLLLQQGYRVEYSAAADALTYAPETFKEFYNQRRRWVPSTMANMIDILASYKNTAKKNDNISYLYIMYQMLMFCSSILGPGTVLMMIAGAFSAVLGTSLWESHLLALGPIIFFILVCFTTRSDTHIMVAMLLSAIYSVVMMIVIVATFVNAFQESLTSPNVIFMITLVGAFFGAGILHPQEVACLIHGFIYFICIPSGYLLLPLYSLCNMNIVTWGTREVPRRKTRAELEEEEKVEEEKRKKHAMKSRGLLSWLGIDIFVRDMREFYTTMVGRNAAQQSSNRSQHDVLKGVQEALNKLNSKLDGQENETAATDERSGSNNELRDMLRRKRSDNDATYNSTGSSSTKLGNLSLWAEQDMQYNNDVENQPITITVPKVKWTVKRDQLVNPAWIEDSSVGYGKKEALGDQEVAFWRQLIRKHLYPLDKDPKREQRTKSELRSMRNNIVSAYIMLNFLWIVIIFQLQLLKETLGDDFFVPIPRYDDPHGEPEQFEPLGFAFLLIFGLVLTLQFIGTLIHRWGTFLHIIARTEIYSSSDTVEGKLRLAEKMQAIGTVPEIDEEFEVPPPDYEEDPYSLWNRSLPRSHAPSEASVRPRNRDLYRRPDKYYYERRMRKQYKRPHEFGPIPVAANTLSRNFQRRYEHLKRRYAEDVDNPMHYGEPHIRHHHHRHQRGHVMDDIYHTIRFLEHRKYRQPYGRYPAGNLHPAL